MAGRGIKRTRGNGAAGLLQLQLQAAKLGMGWLAMSTGAASVIAHRTMMMGRAMTEPARMADPEFALMVTEKLAAAGEAAADAASTSKPAKTAAGSALAQKPSSGKKGK